MTKKALDLLNKLEKVNILPFVRDQILDSRLEFIEVKESGSIEIVAIIDFKSKTCEVLADHIREQADLINLLEELVTENIFAD